MTHFLKDLYNTLLRRLIWHIFERSIQHTFKKIYITHFIKDLYHSFQRFIWQILKWSVPHTFKKIYMTHFSSLVKVLDRPSLSVWVFKVLIAPFCLCGVLRSWSPLFVCVVWCPLSVLKWFFPPSCHNVKWPSQSVAKKWYDIFCLLS